MNICLAVNFIAVWLVKCIFHVLSMSIASDVGSGR